MWLFVVVHVHFAAQVQPENQNCDPVSESENLIPARDFHASSNKKLLVTSALLVVTSALLVVTRTLLGTSATLVVTSALLVVTRSY